MTQETQPRLDELLTRYLRGRSEAQAAGIDPLQSEVTLYEAGPEQPVDAGLAWREALEAQAYYATDEKLTLAPPPGWSILVAQQEPTVALPFCLGHFPQLVRSFHRLYPIAVNHARDTTARSADTVRLQEWAEGLAGGGALLGLAVLRLAHLHDAASAYAAAREASIPKDWRPGWENEKAALAWQRGDARAAREAWARLEPTTPVLFNRGMAELFTGQPASAKPALQQAATQLPASSAWHYLAQLYLTLADMPD